MWKGDDQAAKVHMMQFAGGPAEEIAKLRKQLVDGVAAAEADGRWGTALGYHRELQRQDKVARPTPAPLEAAATMEAGDATRALREVIALASAMVPRLVAGGPGAAPYIDKMYAAGHADDAVLQGLMRDWSVQRPGTGVETWTLTTSGPEGEVTKGGGQKVSTSAERPNPQYGTWVDELVAIEARIQQLGGTLSGRLATERKREFVETHTAVEGSYVRHERHETQASLNRAMQSSIQNMAINAEIHSLEARRRRMLANEPPQTLGGKTKGTNNPDVWQGVRRIQATLETPGWSGPLVVERVAFYTLPLFEPMGTREAYAKLDEKLMKDLLTVLAEALEARVGRAIEQDVATRGAKWTPAQRAEEAAYLLERLGILPETRNPAMTVPTMQSMP